MTVFAFLIPLHNENIEGPDPDIPNPSALFFKAIFFRFLNSGINSDLYGSMITSLIDLFKSS